MYVYVCVTDRVRCAAPWKMGRGFARALLSLTVLWRPPARADPRTPTPTLTPPPPSSSSAPPSLTHSVSSDLKKRIMAARLAKKMTQAQLAQAVNEKPQVIQEYESGKAIPSPAVLSKLSRALGVVLSNKPKK